MVESATAVRDEVARLLGVVHAQSSPIATSLLLDDLCHRDRVHGHHDHVDLRYQREELRGLSVHPERRGPSNPSWPSDQSLLQQ
jgi:hypothetical protein